MTNDDDEARRLRARRRERLSRLRDAQTPKPQAPDQDEGLGEARQRQLAAIAAAEAAAAAAEQPTTDWMRQVEREAMAERTISSPVNDSMSRDVLDDLDLDDDLDDLDEPIQSPRPTADAADEVAHDQAVRAWLAAERRWVRALPEPEQTSWLHRRAEENVTRHLARREAERLLAAERAEQRISRFATTAKAAWAAADHQYAHIIEPWKSDRHRTLLEAVGLTKTRTEVRRNPDGTSTRVTTVELPVLQSCAITETGIELRFRMVSGQSLGDFERAIGALAPELRTKPTAWDAYIDDDGAVALHYRDRELKLPSVILPDPSKVLVARTLLEAEEISRRPALPVLLGATADGQQIELDLKMLPNLFILGAPGAGKSNLVLWLVEQFRLFGGDVVIADGKSSDEYQHLMDSHAPGVLALTRTTRDHIRLVRLVRQVIAKRRQLSRTGAPLRPFLLVIDELAQMRQDVDQLLQNQRRTKSDDPFDKDLNKILAMGRSLNVHVILASQHIYNNTLPGDMQALVPAKMALGRGIKENNLEKVFPDKDTRNEVRSLINSFPKDPRGHIVLQTGENGGLITIKTAFAYSHGAELKPKFQTYPQSIRDSWLHFKERTSKQTPEFSPRVWFEVDKHGEWNESTTVDDILNTPAITLDLPAGVPDKSRAKYDPFHVNYIGTDTGEEHNLPDDIG